MKSWLGNAGGVLLLCWLSTSTSASAADSAVLKGKTVDDCVSLLTKPGFCQIPVNAADAFRTAFSRGEYGRIGPRGAWDAYNGAAWDWPYSYHHGGGHNDSGVIDVYRFDWETGELKRIYTAPPFNNLQIKTGKDGRKLYRAMHDASLPMATHVYDGIDFDPETGLVLVYTGFPYTFGWTPERGDLPDNLRPLGAVGQGIYAFNPTARVIKNVQPGQWRKVADWTAGSFPAMAYVGNGQWVLGTKGAMWKGSWDGDRFVVDRHSRVSAPQNNSPTLTYHDGKLYRLNARYLEIYDPKTLKRTFTYPVNMKSIDHSFSLSFHGDKLLFWNGKGKLTTLDADGNVRIYRYSNDQEFKKFGHVYTKFRKDPRYRDIYVGWSGARTNPVVIRFDGEGGTQAPEYVRTSLQHQVNGGATRFIPGSYFKGVRLSGAKDYDFSGVEAIATPRNHGYVTIDGRAGGPTVVRNLPPLAGGESCVRGQYGARFEIRGLQCAGTRFGIITGNDPDGAHRSEVHIIGGTISGGRNCPETGKCHNVYIGRSKLATVDGLTSLGRSDRGHLFKSRADANVIENSVFDGGQSHHSRLLDFPCGGYVHLKNVKMIQSPNSDNRDLMSMAVESKNCGLHGDEKHTLVLENVDVTATVDKARFLTSHFPVEIVCRGRNTFKGVESVCP